MASDLLKTADLISEYKLLAARANKRLERLEKAGKINTAYKVAGRAVHVMTGGRKTKVRFPVATTGLSDRQIKSRLNKVQEFLNKPTSTVGGEKNIYTHVSATIADRYGLTLTTDQIEQVFEGTLWEKMNARFGSKTAVQIVAAIQKTEGNAKATLEDLANRYIIDENGKKRKIYLSRSEKLSISATVNNYMRSKGIDYLFGE